MAMTIVTGPDSNSLLTKLLNVIGVAEMAPKLERVSLKKGQILHDAGVSMSHVYFATDALISLLQVMQCGEVTETALVGNDGMVGAEIMMGTDLTPNRAFVQCDGFAYRLSIESFSSYLQRSARARELVLAQVRALMVQTAQTVACNRHHTLNQQFCRWVLLALDRLPSEQIRMTHENLAKTLGVRRESVTLAATRFRDDGAIGYSRGRIHVLDRAKLEQHVCECYGIVRRECDRQAAMFDLRASSFMGFGPFFGEHSGSPMATLPTDAARAGAPATGASSKIAESRNATSLSRTTEGVVSDGAKSTES
jgi:CRP-like cAMP-binding protein